MLLNKETVLTTGQNGLLRYTYLDQYDQDGNLISSELIAREIIREAVDEQILIEEESRLVEREVSIQPTTLPATGEMSENLALIGIFSLGMATILGRKRKSQAE